MKSKSIKKAQREHLINRYGKNHKYQAINKTLEKNKEGYAIGNPSKKDKYKIIRRPGYRYSLEENK